MSKRKKIGIGIGVVVLIALVVSSVVLFTQKGDTAEPLPTTTTLDKGAPMPLTGVLERNPNIRMRPVIMLKIDNSPDARPQRNLNLTDVIVEERVEGGITRFIAMYQTNDATPVGPIRSVRSTDAAFIDPFQGLFGYSGGIPAFVTMMRATSATDVGFDRLPNAYERIRGEGRSYEHTLYVDTNKIRSSDLAKKGGTPPAMFTFLAEGEVFAGTGARPVAAASINMGMTRGEFVWDPAKKLWLRNTDGQPHMTRTSAGTEQLTANNVVVQFVPYRNTGQRDPSHAQVDGADLIGSGTGFALIDGKYVDITWNKSSSSDVTTFADTSGATLKLTPGRTWLMLAPTGAATSTR